MYQHFLRAPQAIIISSDGYSQMEQSSRLPGRYALMDRGPG